MPMCALLSPARDDYLYHGLAKTAVVPPVGSHVVCGNVDHAVLIHLVGTIMFLFSYFEFSGED